MGRPKKTAKKPKLRVRKKPLQKVKGTSDILPSEMEYWTYFEKTAQKVVSVFSFQKIETPMLEYTELYQKATGEDTDVVQ